MMLDTIFGPTLTLSTGKVIPTRWIGEQHVRRTWDAFPHSWTGARITPRPWMGRTSTLASNLTRA